MSQKTKLTVQPKAPFDFEATVCSHGWYQLSPFSWDKKKSVLSLVVQLKDGHLISLQISSNKSVENPLISVEIQHRQKLSQDSETEIIGLVSHILRIDEDLSGFYDLCKKQGAQWGGLANGKGRLLRSPTVFEDLVKIICTTNVQWGGTKRMARELVDIYGDSFYANPGLKSFPTAQAIVSDSFEQFKNNVNLGYRADYIYRLAQNVSTGKLDLDSFLDPEISDEALKKKLLAIKGVGNYSAASILTSLGRYNELPIDSVFKEFVSRKYFTGKKYSEKKAQKIYQVWGQWKYLAYWFDMEAG